VANHCEALVSFETPSTCLFSSLSYADADSGEVVDMGWPCGDAVTTWTIAPGYPTESSQPLGAVGPGHFTITIPFDDVEHHIASATFVVE
jgi:hypothetical protein